MAATIRSMPRVALTTSQNTPVASYNNALVQAHLDVERILPGDPRKATDFDGLVLAGGADVNPALYGDARHEKTEDPNDARDATEKRLIEEALEADLPVLAICRGIQMLNVVLGGGLIQHLPNADEHSRKGVPEVHQIRIDPASRLYRIIGASELSVNSRHHQAASAERVGRGLRITARRPDDQVIEAMEMPDRSFVVAVQWHPEDRAATYEADRRLFAAFAEAVSSRSPAGHPRAAVPVSTRT